MFGNLTHMIPTGRPQGPPKDVPPSTPINFPRCYPQVQDDDPSAPASASAQAHAQGQPPRPLTSVLQTILRPAELSISHLEALGAHIIPDSALTDLIPDAAFIPDFNAWQNLSSDDAHAANDSTRRPLNTGNLSPGCQIYLERRHELFTPNEAAFRAVRRVPAPKGQTQARLGNSYEFFRHLESFATFWDDTSKPPTPPAPPAPPPVEANGETEDTKDDTDLPGSDGKANVDYTSPEFFYRTGSGHQMPPEYRSNILSAFLKLVAYDFGCNVSAPRTEPRLYITSTSTPGATANQPRSSYFSSGCTFVFRTPTTREAARAGIVEGPLAAVSARHTTAFPPLRRAPSAPTSASSTSVPSTTSATASMSLAGATDRDSTLDLAREVVAALITAQHRARQGRAEKRFGEGQWWATKPRWGGGPGGPIGREVEMRSGADETIGDKDAPPPLSQAPALASVQLTSSSSPPVVGIDSLRRSRAPGASSWNSVLASCSGASSSSSGNKSSKRLKKSGNLPMYDNYRMVRPPSASWDKKTKYISIGRASGADYDDIFVISSLFHHISILRVRVPDRLLAVLDGEADSCTEDGKRSWGRLEVRRSPWYDFFKAEDRVAAWHTLWAMMAYLMRAEGAPGKEDVEMGGSEGI